MASPGTTSSSVALFLFTLVVWSCRGESACPAKLVAKKVAFGDKAKGEAAATLVAFSLGGDKAPRPLLMGTVVED